MEDLRQDVIDGIVDKIKSGQHLTKQEVRDVLYLCRDHTLLHIARETMSGNIPEKERMSAFNVLQNAVERHALINQEKASNPLEEMANQWKAVVDKSTNVGVEA